MTDVTALAKAVVTTMRRKKSRHVLFLSGCKSGFKLLNQRVVNVQNYDDYEFVGVYSPTVSRMRIEGDLLFNVASYGDMI